MTKKFESNILISSIQVDQVTRDVCAVYWVYIVRVHFVTTIGNLFKQVTPECQRWKQFNEDACPIEVTVSLPELVRNFFTYCDVIEIHN